MAATANEAYDLEEIEDGEGRELIGGALSQITGSELEAQISVAKRYPRSIRTFQREAVEMVTLSEEIAGECMYALPRAGKKIEGPSARFAEVVANAWGNCRAGARTMDDDGKFITAMGFFFDTQRNVAITYEVKRRITDKTGKRLNDDMIGVTANAACSIALRNAVLKGVPKAFWKQVYDKARECAIGNAETLGERRTKMLQYFAKLGAQPAQVFELLEVAGEQDITLDHLAQLKGLATAIKDGDTTVDQAFGKEPAGKPGVTKAAPLKKQEPATKAESPAEGINQEPPPFNVDDAFAGQKTNEGIDNVAAELKSDPNIDMTEADIDAAADRARQKIKPKGQKSPVS